VSHLFLAVSKTSSPATTESGDWFFYASDATLAGRCGPTGPTGLGVDGSVVVLTANVFSLRNTFQRAKIGSLTSPR
jgi:hypothetical protein